MVVKCVVRSVEGGTYERIMGVDGQIGVGWTIRGTWVLLYEGYVGCRVRG